MNHLDSSTNTWSEYGGLPGRLPGVHSESASQRQAIQDWERVNRRLYSDSPPKSTPQELAAELDMPYARSLRAKVFQKIQTRLKAKEINVSDLPVQASIPCHRLCQ
jgi:hypothetical protein